MADWEGIQRILGMNLAMQKGQAENRQREAIAIRGREESTLRQFGINPRNMSHKQVASAYDILLNEQTQLAAAEEKNRQQIATQKRNKGIYDAQQASIKAAKDEELDQNAKRASYLEAKIKAGESSLEEQLWVNENRKSLANVEGAKIDFTSHLVPTTAEEDKISGAAKLQDTQARNQRFVDVMTPEVVYGAMKKRYSGVLDESFEEHFADLNSELHAAPSEFLAGLEDYFLSTTKDTDINQASIAQDWSRKMYMHLRKDFAKEPSSILDWFRDTRLPVSTKFEYPLYPQEGVAQADQTQVAGQQAVGQQAVGQQVTAETLDAEGTFAWVNDGKTLGPSQQKLAIAFENLLPNTPENKNWRDTLMGIAFAESNFNNKRWLENALSTATGPFQFTDPTGYDMLKRYFDTDKGVREGVFAGIGNKSFSTKLSFYDVIAELSPNDEKQFRKNINRWVLDPEVALKLVQALVIDNAKVWKNTHSLSGVNYGAAIASHHLGPNHLGEVYKRYKIAPSESPTKLIPKLTAEWKGLTKKQQESTKWEQEKEFMDWWPRYLGAKERAGEYNGGVDG